MSLPEEAGLAGPEQSHADVPDTALNTGAETGADTRADSSADAGTPADTAADGELSTFPATPPALSPYQRLKQQPTRFSLDQAVAVVAPGRAPEEVDFRTLARLGAPAGEVALHERDGQALVSPSFGLVGPGGVLPRHYTAWVDAEDRRRSTAMHGFVDLLARRFTGLYVKAGAKPRPSRNPRLAQEVLAAAAGLATPHVAAALTSPLPALLHHAGGLSARARSADRLRGMLAEETGLPVRIVEFSGGWMRLPASEQTRLAGAGQAGRHDRLGMDASVGDQVWDAASCFTIELGPMPLATFRSLLPGTPLHTRLVELTRLQAGVEQDFVIKPVLAAEAVPPLRLGTAAAAGTAGQGSAADSVEALDPGARANTPAAGAQLGWTSWLTSARPRRAPAAEARLRPGRAGGR